MTTNVDYVFISGQKFPSWIQDKTIKQEAIISTSTEINTWSFNGHGLDGQNYCALSALAGLAFGKADTTMGEIDCQKYEEQPGQEGKEITLQGQGWTARWRLGPTGELTCYADGPSIEMLSTKWNEYKIGSQKDYDCAIENARKLAKSMIEVNKSPEQLRHCPGH